MGASKTKQFSEYEKNIAKVGRALAHPARVRILEILYHQEWCRNTELSVELQLSPSSVHNHLQKLKEAQMIEIDFLPTFYKISLKENGFDNFKHWSTSLS
jgi:ArsR family transcriptional regulator, arsenate/arsenite/antimonite-responsive transcriptional repressor